MEINDETWRVARVRVRRQAEEEEGILTRVEQEVERDARIVADTTGMPTWSGGPHSHRSIQYLFICSVTIFDGGKN